MATVIRGAKIHPSQNRNPENAKQIPLNNIVSLGKINMNMQNNIP